MIQTADVNAALEMQVYDSEAAATAVLRRVFQIFCLRHSLISFKTIQRKKKLEKALKI